MPNLNTAPETRTFVQISRFRNAGVYNAANSHTTMVREAPLHGLSVVTIRVNVKDVTDKNEADVLGEVSPEVYRPREGDSFGIGVKVYELSPTGRVIIKKLTPSNVIPILMHNPEVDFESAYVQTGFEGEFKPETTDSDIGRLSYTEARSDIVAGMEMAEEIRLGFVEQPRSLRRRVVWGYGGLLVFEKPYQQDS